MTLEQFLNRCEEPTKQTSWSVYEGCDLLKNTEKLIKIIRLMEDESEPGFMNSTWDKIEEIIDG